MSIPVVSIPKQGPIATRPRREQIWDTEGCPGNTAVKSLVTVFKSASNFNSSSVGATTMALAKVKPRDTNMEADGQLPKGTMFHYYGHRLKFRPLNQNVAVQNAIAGIAAQQAIFATVEAIRLLRETTTIAFRFGSSNIFWWAPAYMVPAGASQYTHTVGNTTDILFYNPEQQDVTRLNSYDVTLNGLPTEIIEQESFAVDHQAYDGTSGATFVIPTATTGDIYFTDVLTGVLFRGIQG